MAANASPENKPLTPKQKRFVEEYLIDLNAAGAAERAGYSANAANVEGCRLMKKSHIAAAIRAAQGARSERMQITADQVLAEYAKLGFANMLDYIRVNDQGEAYVDFTKLTREQAAAIAEVTSEVYQEGRGEDAKDVKRTKFKLADKKGALDSIAKHLGMFVDRHEHAGPGGGPIPFQKIERLIVDPQDSNGAGVSAAAEVGPV
jgi:phage terminase small subunit